jgi:hypothetical protein
VPLEAVKLEEPEYDPVTVSVPSGADEVLHEAALPTRAPVIQSVVVPTVNVTVPVGVPLAEVTEAEYVTALPKLLDVGLTETVVVVD